MRKAELRDKNSGRIDQQRSVSDVHIEALYMRHNKQPPFKPSSRTHEYENVFENSREIETFSLRKSEQLLANGLVDAETREPIRFSRATWNVKEGRLDLKTDIIVAMGTGKLDIKKKNRPNIQLKAEIESTSKSQQYLKPATNPMSLPPLHFSETERLAANSPPRHPIVTQYLLEGPLNPRYHNYWDKRSDKILVADEEQLDQLAEEDVDFNLISTPPAAASTLAERQACLQKSSAKPPYSSNIAILSVNGRQDDSTAFSDGHTDDLTADTFSTVSPLNTATSLSVGNLPLPRRVRSPNLQYDVDAFLGQTLAMRNVRNWQAVEEKSFQELYAIAWQYEKNKSLTGESSLSGGMQEARTICRQLAKLKTKSLKEVALAIADERKRDEMRKQLERKNAERPIYLKELMKTHNEERKKAKLYISALERDNEIIFIRKLSETGYLW